MLPGSCEGDSDCQGERTCDGGWCRGKSNCKVCNGLKPSSGGKDSAELCYNLAFYKDRADHLRDDGKSGLVCDVCRPTPGASGPEQPIYARIAGALPITFEGDSTALRSLDGRQRCERLLTALMKLPKIGGWGRIEKLTECTVYDGSGGANAGDVEALQLELKLNMPHHLVAAAIHGMPRAFHLPRQKVVRTVGADGLKEDQAPDPPVAKNFSAAEPPPSLKLQRALVVADKDYTFGNPVDDRTCGENKDEVCPKVYLELKTGDVLDLDPPNEDIDRAELFKKMLNEESPSGALGSRHDKIDAPSITSSNAFETSKRFVVEPSIEAARQLLGTVVKLPAGKYDGFGEEEQTRYATYTEPLQWLLARLLSQCTVPGGEWEVEPRGSRPLDDDPETLTQLEVVLRPAAAPMPIQSLPQPVEKLHQERTQCNGGSTFASDGLDPRNCAEIVSVAASCKGKLFSFKREREGEMGKCACCPGDEVDPLPDNDEAVEAATYTQEESDTEEPSERALSERRRERATQCMDALVPFVSNVRLKNDPLARVIAGITNGADEAKATKEKAEKEEAEKEEAESAFFKLGATRCLSSISAFRERAKPYPAVVSRPRPSALWPIKNRCVHPCYPRRADAYYAKGGGSRAPGRLLHGWVDHHDTGGNVETAAGTRAVQAYVRLKLTAEPADDVSVTCVGTPDADGGIVVASGARRWRDVDSLSFRDSDARQERSAMVTLPKEGWEEAERNVAVAAWGLTEKGAQLRCTSNALGPSEEVLVGLRFAGCSACEEAVSSHTFFRCGQRAIGSGFVANACEGGAARGAAAPLCSGGADAAAALRSTSGWRARCRRRRAESSTRYARAPSGRSAAPPRARGGSARASGRRASGCGRPTRTRSRRRASANSRRSCRT